jgi:lambda repressor-like predicted transcriptional regulator
MEVVDDYEIEDILARVKEDGYGLNTLVVEALASRIFRSR